MRLRKWCSGRSWKPPKRPINSMTGHCISLEIIICHELFVKEKTNLQSYCVDIVDVSVRFVRLIRINNGGEKLCTLRFPSPLHWVRTAYTRPTLFHPSSFSRATKEGSFLTFVSESCTHYSLSLKELKAIHESVSTSHSFSNFSWQLARADMFQRKCL